MSAHDNSFERSLAGMVASLCIAAGACAKPGNRQPITTGPHGWLIMSVNHHARSTHNVMSLRCMYQQEELEIQDIQNGQHSQRCKLYTMAKPDFTLSFVIFHRTTETNPIHFLCFQSHNAAYYPQFQPNFMLLPTLPRH